jgi:hypothetical protein
VNIDNENGMEKMHGDINEFGAGGDGRKRQAAGNVFGVGYG